MKYPALSFKNQKLLKELRKYGDMKLDFKNSDFPDYKEADIYEIIECGYFRCDPSKSHIRTFENNWDFVGFVTYKGHTYNKGRFKEYFKGIGQLGGWVSLVKFILEICNYL